MSQNTFMRAEFARCLMREMDHHSNITLLTADLGYGMLDAIRDKYSESKRFINVGASEQAMVGIAVGMALSGIIPVCYSITPFLLCRPYEWLRNYLHHERIPVKLVGSGRDAEYEKDGWTHSAVDAKSILLALDIDEYWPKPNECFWPTLQTFLHSSKPAFMSLSRK